MFARNLAGCPLKSHCVGFIGTPGGGLHWNTWGAHSVSFPRTSFHRLAAPALWAPLLPSETSGPEATEETSSEKGSWSADTPAWAEQPQTAFKHSFNQHFLQCNERKYWKGKISLLRETNCYYVESKESTQPVFISAGQLACKMQLILENGT